MFATARPTWSGGALEGVAQGCYNGIGPISQWITILASHSDLVTLRDAGGPKWFPLPAAQVNRQDKYIHNRIFMP